LSNELDHRIGFIVGSPRSGTTLLGDILDLHSQISRWYEPYFKIDHHFRSAPDDVLTAEDATPNVKRYIRASFKDYRERTGCGWIIDKSPRNSLKIPFLLEIFPSAKFIHLIRDGRDTILSINREWNRRDVIIGYKNQPLEILRVVWRFANRQSLLQNKIAALRFEYGSIAERIRGKPFLHKIRWKGRVGWGPRFHGWQDLIDNVSVLEFGTEQWVQCVGSILEHKDEIKPENYLTLRYEDLLKNHEETLRHLTNFLGISEEADLTDRMPTLNRRNYGKWKTAFSQEELARIGPRISPTLQKLGYADDGNWFKHEVI